MKGRKGEQGSKVLLKYEDDPRPSNASPRKSYRKSPKSHSKRKGPISRKVSCQRSIRQDEKQKPCPEAPAKKDASDANNEFIKIPAPSGYGKSLHACHTCGKTFDRKSSVQSHMVVHRDVKPYSCEVCKKQFARKGDVAKHFLIHVDEKRYLCDRCGMQFRKGGSFHRHMRSHNGEKTQVCHICGRAYSRPEDLKMHVAGHNEKTIQCELCGKLMASTMALRKHNRVHTGEGRKQQKRPLGKIHFCTLCGRSFSLKSTLRNHKKTHDQHRDHVNSCDICGTKFYHKDSLKRHMHLHSDTKPFCCEFCGRGFNQHVRYRVHVQKYHPDKESPNQSKKPLACELCSKVFTKAADLADHVCYQKSDALCANSHLLDRFENFPSLNNGDTSLPDLDQTTQSHDIEDESEDTVDYDFDRVKTFDVTCSSKIIPGKKDMCDTEQNSIHVGDETEMETKLGTTENSEMKSLCIIKKVNNGTNVDVNLRTVNNNTGAGIAVDTVNNYDTNVDTNANANIINSNTKSDVHVSFKTVNDGTHVDVCVEDLKSELYAGTCKSLDENKSLVITDKIETEANISYCEGERNVRSLKAMESEPELSGNVKTRTRGGLRKYQAQREVNEIGGANNSYKSRNKYNTRSSKRSEQTNQCKVKIDVCMSERKGTKKLSGAREGYVTQKRNGARNQNGKRAKNRNKGATKYKRPTKCGRQSRNCCMSTCKNRSDIPHPCISVNILNTNDTIADDSMEMSCDEIVTDKDTVYAEECTHNENVGMNNVKIKTENFPQTPVWPVEMFSRETIKTETGEHVYDNFMNPGSTSFSGLRTLKQEPLEEGEIIISEDQTFQFDIITPPIKKEH